MPGFVLHSLFMHLTVERKTVFKYFNVYCLKFVFFATSKFQFTCESSYLQLFLLDENWRIMIHATLDKSRRDHFIVNNVMQ